MFSIMTILPDLTPRDPHDLWYTSRHAPSVPHHLLNNTRDPSSTGAGHHDAQGGGQNHHPQHPHPRDRDHRRALVERTPLARLRLDEQQLERRRANVSNYGSAWLKPPGVPKTLFQMREERREQEEQAEAQRREQMLQAQMAEAGGGGPEILEDDEQMEDNDQEQDLDDDIPEADGFGFDGEESEEEEEDDDDDDDDDDGEEETVSGSEAEDHAGAVLVSPAEQEQVRDIRAAEDRMREVMMAADAQEGGMAMGDPFVDEESREGLLEEDDLVHLQPQTPAGNNEADTSMGMDLDMDANLDESIPEGDDDDMYEHTDSDEDISDDATREISFAGRSSVGGRAPQGSRLRRSAHGSVRRASLRGRDRGSLAPSDMDISGLLSNNESSFLGPDSPYMGRG